jgi:hypothetical protein
MNCLNCQYIPGDIHCSRCNPTAFYDVIFYKENAMGYVPQPIYSRQFKTHPRRHLLLNVELRGQGQGIFWFLVKQESRICRPRADKKLRLKLPGGPRWAERVGALPCSHDYSYQVPLTDRGHGGPITSDFDGKDYRLTHSRRQYFDLMAAKRAFFITRKMGLLFSLSSHARREIFRVEKARMLRRWYKWLKDHRGEIKKDYLFDGDIILFDLQQKREGLDNFDDDDKYPNTIFEQAAFKAEALPFSGSNPVNATEERIHGAIDNSNTFVSLWWKGKRLKPVRAGVQSAIDWQLRTRWPLSFVVSKEIEDYAHPELAEQQSRIFYKADKIYGPGLKSREIAQQESMKAPTVRKMMSRKRHLLQGSTKRHDPENWKEEPYWVWSGDKFIDKHKVDHQYAKVAGIPIYLNRLFFQTLRQLWESESLCHKFPL